MLARSIDRFASYLGQSGMGRLKLRKPVNAANTKKRIGSGLHHMGTTRMSDDPATGVVDSNCRVFGVDNLYIAGSSVFPSVGFSNPTLTIVALACRMANHLNEELSTS
jgi:choline dehydrogenase-like flavoprotein